MITGHGHDGYNCAPQTYFEGLSEDAKARYRSKLERIGGIDPFSSPLCEPVVVLSKVYKQQNIYTWCVCIVKFIIHLVEEVEPSFFCCPLLNLYLQMKTATSVISMAKAMMITPADIPPATRALRLLSVDEGVVIGSFLVVIAGVSVVIDTVIIDSVI